MFSRPISPFLYTLLLLPSLHAVFASTPGNLNFYIDFYCKKPSTITPTVSLPLLICLQTTNGYSGAIGAYPPCPSGLANLIFYNDPICGVTTTVNTALASDNCFQMAAGDQLFDARSLMFACASAADHPLPTSTSTVIISQLAPVATESAGGGGSGGTTSVGGSESGSTTSVGGSGSGSTTSTAALTPTQTSSGSNTGSGSGSGSGGGGITSASSGSSGLSTSDIVAIAVGLGVGVPTIAIMLLAWLFPDFRHKVRRWVSSWLHHVFTPHEEQPHLTHADTRQVYQGHAFPHAPSQFHGYGGQAPYNPVQYR